MVEIYKKLTTNIKEKDNFIIMTHSNPDLDGFASSVCLYEIIKSFGKNVYIYLNKKIDNSAINNMLNITKELNINYINKDSYKTLDNFTLIILDLNKEALLGEKEILKYTNDIILIDHHIKSNDYISNTILSYIDSNLSSIAEFMCGYIIYLNKKINPIIATSLVAAMAIDTNNFTIKTTASTHEKAAYLLKIGATNNGVLELLKEDKEKYMKRQDLLKNTHIFNKNIAICQFDDNIYRKEDLARSSQELITFQDIEVGFTIGKLSKSNIGISARSTGKIDVEQIMKKFNGGGHLTEAACVIEKSTIIDAYNKLLEVLNESNIYKELKGSRKD